MVLRILGLGLLLFLVAMAMMFGVSMVQHLH
jgi:hypothetical protein